MNLTALIKNDCANYFPDSGGKGTIKNYCCLIDQTCSYFGDSGRCNYFETSVLPLNPELEFKYKTERKLNISNPESTCRDCSSLFIKKFRNEKYCPKCKVIRKREQKKSYMQKSRRAS